MSKFNTHQVTMRIKKSIKQQTSKQKRHIAPKSREFRSRILRKVIDNGKNNSLNTWILYNPKIWGTHLNRREVVMWQEKGCSSQAETWQVKNILMKDFDWQVKCDVFVVSMATWTIEYNLQISLLLSLHKICSLDFPINLHTAYYNY